MKYRVVLFQPYLRQFVFNFGKVLKQGEFVSTITPRRSLYTMLPSFENEILRVKTTWRHWLRRIIGIPNVRFRYERKGDILFTYGSLLITNKPYCAYLETGLSLYNYDLGIAKNPIARFLVMLLATRKSCHRLIFLSEASKKSFFSTVSYPKKVSDILRNKSVVIYPLPLIDTSKRSPKIWSGKLKILFVGQFYMKGGRELVNAFLNLEKRHHNIKLTLVTPLHTLKKEDIEKIRSHSNIRLEDAVLSAEEMRALYKSHDVFCLPTYRDGFGLVLIEAIANGMPLIITDQYATSEMVREGVNGFVFHNHPLQDYDPATYRLLGKYYNPKAFYADLFRLQKSGGLRPVEEFIAASLEHFLVEPGIFESYSKNSLKFYSEKFDAEKIAHQIEDVFLEAIRK